MALALNGTTQLAHADWAITLPFTMAVWARRPIPPTNSKTAYILHGVDSAASVGNFIVGTRFVSTYAAPRQTLSAGTVARTTTETVANVTPVGSVAITNIDNVGVTSLTLETADEAWRAGDWVRVEGTTGLTPELGGRDWEIASVTGGSTVLNLVASTTGTPTGTWTANPSAFQGEDRWSLLVVTYDATARRLAWAGHEGRSFLTHSSSNVTNTSISSLVAAVNRVCIGGNLQSGTINNPLAGEIAHAAVWQGVYAGASQALELLTVAPNAVTWGAPSNYWPLLANENDAAGSANLTLVDTPTINSDGPTLGSSGGGGGAFIPSAMRARIINAFGVR
jgi:hypothetical protein